MAELIDAVKLVKQGKIKPIVTQTFPLEEAETAHQMILANKISGRAAWVI
jgi:D-arabinose 1-dehydrogenase-like Zn-dependent alcohol dehydrogenase